MMNNRPGSPPARGRQNLEPSSEIEKPSLPDAAVRAGLASIPVVGPALLELWSFGRQLDERRIRQTGMAARETAGDERLLRRLREDERLLDMLTMAVEAGRRTTWEAKRVTMGRVLGRATFDDADIDDNAALLATLAALEAPHFRWLAEIEQLPATPGARVVVPEPYNAVIRANGLVTEVIDGGGPLDQGGVFPTGLTEYGRRLVSWVRETETDLVGEFPAPNPSRTGSPQHGVRKPSFV